MRSTPHTAYVLHRRRYRESSLLLDCLSAAYGRVGVIAKGAARPKKRATVPLQAFQRFTMTWVGRGELRTLVAHDTGGMPLSLNGTRLFSGFYANELLMRLTGRDDPNAEVFAAYEQTLRELGRDERPVEPILRGFEKAMLDACGYGLQLATDVENGGAIDPAASYNYVVEQGPMLNADAHRGVTVSGATLLALDGRAEFDAARWPDAKRLMRFVLHHYIGDRPLASRALFRAPGKHD
ncbi:MAG: DNA repair protein RecO [Gammaproteobacteria bacterium]